VDWMLPVGQWLDTLDALLGFGPAYYSSSYLRKGTWTGNGRTFFESNYSISNSWSERKRYVRLERTASSGVPFPAFPSFKDPRSLGHMANGLALLAGAFGRHVSKRS
jgi:hypothetical protein